MRGGRRRKMRAMYMRTALICVLLMAAGLAFFWYRSERAYTGYIVTEAERGDGPDAKAVTFGGRILRYSKAGAEVLDAGMTSLARQSFEMTSPEAKISGKYALVYDKGGREGYLFSADGRVTALAAQGIIGTGAVSSRGNAVLIVKEEGLSAHFTDGSGFAEESLAFEDFVPLAAAVSGNENTLVFSGVRTDTGASEMRFYNKKDLTLTASFDCGGTVIPVLAPLSGNRVLAVGDDKVFMFRAGKDPKEISARETGGAVLMTVSDGKRAAVLARNRETGKNELAVWNAAGLTARTETEFEPEKAAVSGNEILLYNRDSLLIVSASGRVRFEGTVSEKGPVKLCVRITDAKYRITTDYGTFEYAFS